VRVGDRISLLFEDRATVWYQTQEMVWVEHITDLDAIRDELAVYGALLPGRSELSATLLIEITEYARIRDELGRMRGIDEHVWLDVEGERVAVPSGPRAKQAVGGAVRPPARGGRGPGSSTARRWRSSSIIRVPCSAVPEAVRHSLVAELTTRRRPRRPDGCAMADSVQEGDGRPPASRRAGGGADLRRGAPDGGAHL
jgi:hypothetical protein